MERLEGIINTYAWELVGIELLRQKLIDDGIHEKYFTVLELATKAAKDKLYEKLDDLPDELLEQESHFVQTDPRIGINEDCAHKVIEILTN